MGYRLLIGEKTIEREEYDGELVEHIYAKEIENDQAPDNGIGYKDNTRSPSYRGWWEFREATGSHGLFDELINEHPGCVDLTRDHLETLVRIYNTYKKKNKQSTDEFVNYNINRLEWLVFWVEWALNNCKNPVFVNR